MKNILVKLMFFDIKVNKFEHILGSCFVNQLVCTKNTVTSSNFAVSNVCFVARLPQIYANQIFHSILKPSFVITAGAVGLTLIVLKILSKCLGREAMVVDPYAIENTSFSAKISQADSAQVSAAPGEDHLLGPDLCGHGQLLHDLLQMWR